MEDVPDAEVVATLENISPSQFDPSAIAAHVQPQRAERRAAVMPVLAIVLLAFGWLAIVPRSDLALLEHGLMMPVMLIPMFIRLDLYAGRTGHNSHPFSRS